MSMNGVWTVFFCENTQLKSFRRFSGIEALTFLWYTSYIFSPFYDIPLLLTASFHVVDMYSLLLHTSYFVVFKHLVSFSILFLLFLYTALFSSDFATVCVVNAITFY